MGILVCHIYKIIEEFLGKSSCVLNNYKCLLSLHKHIMETEFNIWVKDDTFNKKKISTLLKEKTETSSFRVYKKSTTMSDKASNIIRWFSWIREKKMVASLLSDEIHERTYPGCNRQSLLANKTNYS